jgi:hypothetical protein
MHLERSLVVERVGEVGGGGLSIRIFSREKSTTFNACASNLKALKSCVGKLVCTQQSND